MLRCRSTRPTSGSDAPARSISVASACRNRCVPRRSRPARSQALPMTALTDSGVSGRQGRRTVTNTDRDSHFGRPCSSQAASASPAGAGSGSRSVLLPLPVTAISPARQSMSPSCAGLSTPQAEPGQQRQDRVVPQARRGLPVAAGQQPLDLRRLQAPGQRRHPPRCDCGNRSRQRDGCPPGRVGEPQERPQRRHHRLRRPRVAALRPVHHERGHPARVQLADRPCPADPGQERLRLLGIAPHRHRRQAPLPVQPRAELRQQHRAVPVRLHAARTRIRLHDHLPVWRNTDHSRQADRRPAPQDYADNGKPPTTLTRRSGTRVGITRTSAKRTTSPCSWMAADLTSPPCMRKSLPCSNHWASGSHQLRPGSCT